MLFYYYAIEPNFIDFIDVNKAHQIHTQQKNYKQIPTSWEKI